MTLAAIDEHRPGGLVVVPVMLQRIVALDAATLAKYDTSSLRYIASSGSALGVPLRASGAQAVRTGALQHLRLDRGRAGDGGDARGSSRVTSTAGRVALGSTARILDEHGHEVPTGTTGRVFVGSGAAFEGYTGGGTKEVVDGLMSSGDVGHFDAAGRLFIDGRDDDMIASGGENVSPAEVEDLLAAHPAVAEAAVVGVDDADFGQVPRHSW